MSRRRDLTSKVHEDLAIRSLHGTWGQPCVLMLVLLTTDFVVRAPVLAWGACALLLIQTILRLILIKRMHVLYPRNPGRWEILHLALILFCAGFWGAMRHSPFGSNGYHDQNTLVFLLCGSIPSVAAAKMLIREDRSTEGTIGGGCVEADVRKKAPWK
jgi:hypothetical protein